ncbi:MAG: GTPase [Anaerovoracaceae bacterium]
MKQLIVALIGETGSGKSTFTAMCTEEKIHEVIAGSSGQKGTTKNTKRMTFAPDLQNFDYENFKKHYSEGKGEFSIPLSAGISLSPFSVLTILDTQGINDCKSKQEEKDIYDSILKACDEADIIFVTIPEGGNVVTTTTILQEIFNRYCHKPIIYIYRAQQSRVKLLKKEKAIKSLIPFAKNNISKYSEIYPTLGNIIENTVLPECAGISPLLCILPNSEELSSDIEASDRVCDNIVLQKYINNTLQYAINLQKLLLEAMSREYINNNLSTIEEAVQMLRDISQIANSTKNLTGIPLCRPFVKNHDYQPEKNMEYSWQGGTPSHYPVCGGDYTYAANNIYNNIKNLIRQLSMSVAVKSSLLAVLDSKSEDRWTPGSFNLPYLSFLRGVPISWILEIRTAIYNKYPDLFRDVNDEDFDNPKQIEYWRKTDAEIKNLHGDWDKYLHRFYYYPDGQQDVIKVEFGNRQWQATVLINATAQIIEKIDFCRSLNEKIKKDFDSVAFDSQGKCVLWDEKK